MSVPEIVKNALSRVLHDESLTLNRQNIFDLVNAGADPNYRDEYGRTPLMVAETCEQIIAYINSGADVNARDNNGRTPLMHHATDVDIMEALLSYGADVNDRDNNGYTAKK